MHIIITGAAQGIGKGIAQAFAQLGHTVIVTDKNEQLGTLTAEQLRAQGYDAHFYALDVASAAQIEDVFTRIHAQFGAIDVLVNNAGYAVWEDPLTLSVDDFDKIIQTNLRSVFLCAREAAKYMKESGGGAIISMASTRAFMSEPHTEGYAAAKGGIVALTHALAASFAPYHITVNCISPGWIETADYDELRDIDHAQHFSNRVGKVEDIANMCVFLSQKENNFMNGQNITIDGGMTKKMIYEH